MADIRVVQFLRGMDIKKASIGGFDKIATFEKFKELVALYEQIIQESQQVLLDENQRLTRENQSLSSRPAPVPQETDQLNSMTALYKQKDARIAELELQIASNHVKAMELQNAVRAIQKKSEDAAAQMQHEHEQIMREARSRAEQICRDAQTEALRHRARVMDDVEFARKEKQDVLKEKKDILAELRLVQDQLNVLLTNAICNNG